MRTICYFVDNDLVKKLLSRFPISQGNLYHYTSDEAAAGIAGGGIWMTRADCFLDESEIRYGESVIEEAAINTLKEPDRSNFLGLLLDVRKRLSSTYVLSMSQDSCCEYLKDKYGENVIEFGEMFPQSFSYEGMHSIPTGNDSYRCHFFDGLYRFFEGEVIYGREEQCDIAKEICIAYIDLISSENAHKVDVWHFIDLMTKCLLLFKQSTFSSEREYRLTLTHIQDGGNDFEFSRNVKGKSSRYIKVSYPSDSIRNFPTRVSSC